MGKDEMNSVEIYQQVLRGTRKRFPNYYFNGQEGFQRLIQCTRFLIEDVLRIPESEIPKRVSAELLWSHRLRPPANKHQLNFTDLMATCYPNVSVLDYKQVSNGYWVDDSGYIRGIEMVRKAIEETCNIPLREIPRVVNYKFFYEHKLTGIFNRFEQSPYAVINAVYPGIFHPWEFATVPMHFWENETNVKDAMHWLIYEKLEYTSWSEANIKLKMTDFERLGLGGLFTRRFHRRMQSVRQWIRDSSPSD